MSKYKGVSKHKKISDGHTKLWMAQKRLSDGTFWRKNCETERQAAIAYDLKLIELGKDPVNILKPTP